MAQYKLNFHVTENCNFNCKFCFARYETKELSLEEKKQAIAKIAESGRFSEINFAGGEPFLCKGIEELILFSYNQGLKVSVITNGFLLTNDVLARILPYISMLGISVHSFNDTTKCAIGACTNKGEILSNQRLTEICKFIEEWNHQKKSSCQIKINTVVCKENMEEDFLLGIDGLQGIKRWKLLRCQAFGKNQNMLISKQEYDSFCKRNQSKLVSQVFEDDMSRSYIMMNPTGDFISNPGNGKRYENVGSVFSESVELLLKKINLDETEYRQRYAS